MRLLVHVCVALWAMASNAAIVTFAGTSGDSSTSAAIANGALLNTTLAALSPGDTFVIPNRTFHYMGGVFSDGLTDVTIQIDGTLKLCSDRKHYPTDPSGMPIDAIQLANSVNLKLTSSFIGTLDGQGGDWWGIVKYLSDTNHRPIMLHVKGATNLLIEKILFKDSPRFHVYAERLEGAEIRDCVVDARWPDDSGNHDVHDLSAFNTDGFDVSGNNVWIHDW